MKQNVIEQLAVSVFNCSIDRELEVINPNPWNCCQGYREECAEVYSWTPEAGFKSITQNSVIPKSLKQVSAYSHAEPVELPNFRISDIHLPEGVYLILLYEKSPTWEDTEYETLRGKIIIR